MIFKTLVVIVFLFIVGSLASALFHLVKRKDSDPEQSLKTVKALTFRIGLSLVLFIFVIIALKLGWFEPSGMVTRMHATP